MTSLAARMVLAAAIAALPAHAASPWTERRGDGFVLLGQLAAAPLDAVACDLDTAARTLRGATASGAAPHVIAVDSARAIREWLPEFNERGRGNPLGAYWRGLFGDHIVIRVDTSPAERLRRVLHEYAHFATHEAHPDPAPWLDEGTSEIWEHTRVVNGAIEVGGPVAEHLKRLRSGKGWIPVAEVLAANRIPTRSTTESAMFYAESWALVHYLMFAKDSGSLALSGAPDAADIPADATLKTYVAAGMVPSVKLLTTEDAAPCSGAGVNKDLSPIDILLERSHALADGERPDAALPLLREASALDPASIDARETLGFVQFRGNRPAEAAAVFDATIASGRASFISYYYRSLLAEPIPAKTDGSGPIPQVEYLRRALALNPGFRPAVVRLRELTGKGLRLP